jgi:hypothetical protein
MIKKIRYGSLVYDTFFNTIIGDALKTPIKDLVMSSGTNKSF